MISFLLGAIAMAALTIGLVFLKFARRTRDRLFLFFTAFFWLEALGRTLQVFGGLTDNDPTIYVMRVVAFCLIVVGIADKNLVNRV